MFRRRTVFFALSCFVAIAHVAAEDKKASDSRAKDVAVSLTDDGSIFRRQAEGKPWQPVKEGEALNPGDLLLGLADSALKSGNGAVKLSFIGNLDGNSPFPILESAVILKSEPKDDLEFALDRGRVDLINTRDKGAATVRVHVCRGSFDLVLEEPGARVALETYGRWLKGQPFPKDEKDAKLPCRSLVVMVVHGQAMVKHGDHEWALSAPPGPAMMQWDNLTNETVKPQRLESLPEWADPKVARSPVGQAKKEILDRFRKRVLDNGLDATVTELLNSDAPNQRRLAVVIMAATDDLPRLAMTLMETKHADVWDNGVLALRHWIGRGEGQDMKLFKGLIEKRKMPPGQAEIIMQLLHSFSDEDLALPETYELLIDYLDHEILGIRGLAAWHLYRLAPAGKNIKYHPTDPKESRDKAQKEWRKLIPPGKLPPKVKVQED